MVSYVKLYTDYEGHLSLSDRSFLDQNGDERRKKMIANDADWSGEEGRSTAGFIITFTGMLIASTSKEKIEQFRKDLQTKLLRKDLRSLEPGGGGGTRR